jgi:hypothetical protein
MDWKHDVRYSGGGDVVVWSVINFAKRPGPKLEKNYPVR